MFNSSSRSVPATLVAAIMATSLASVGPVQARPVESGTETFTFTDVFNNFCGVGGLKVSFYVVGTVRYRIEARGADGYVFYADKITSDATITNVRTGAYVTSHQNTMFKDLRIADNGDGTHTIIAFGTGNAYVYDSSGKVLGRNPGQTRFEVIIDLNGTPADFSDDEVISQEVTLGSTGRNDDFCTAVVPALTA